MLSNAIAVYIFPLFVSIAMYIDSRKKFEKNSLRDKLFMLILLINSILLVLSPLTIAFDGLPGRLNTMIAITANIFLYCGTIFVGSLWVLYVNYQIYHSVHQVKKTILFIFPVVLIELVMTLLSPFTGWFFYLDALNVYHRGYLFAIHTIINLGLLISAIIVLYYKRKSIRSRYFSSLVFFSVPPFVLSIFQVLFYGLELIWGGITVSLLIIYFNVQNHTMNIDYLTGAFNRKNLDGYLLAKINEASEEKTFSAIMLDLNDFKNINDTFGHTAGDVILKDTVKILSGIVRRNDIVSRFGGDEFILILDISSYNELLLMVSRIQNAISRYNEMNIRPYTLSVCMGYDVYDCKSGMGASEFLDHIDSLMYREKRQNKQGKTNK